MRELRGLLLDLRRGASAFSRKAVLLVAAISAAIVLIALEKGDRKASTIKVRDVVAADPHIAKLRPPTTLGARGIPPPLPVFGPLLDETVATDENAWTLLRRTFRDQIETERLTLVRNRIGLYDKLDRVTQEPTYGINLALPRGKGLTIGPNATLMAQQYRAALDINAAQMAALIEERDRFLDDAHEQVNHAFAAAQRKPRTITGFDTADGFLKEFFDRGSALHAVYDTIWYAALAIAVVSLSAFIFIAVIQILSLPSKLTEAFNAHIGELLEKAPDLMKHLGTAEALKTGAASVIALTVGFSAVRGTADHAKSSPVNDNAPIEAGVLSPSDFAWSSRPEFSREAGSLPGRDGQLGRDGRDGKAGRDPAAGRDGRDGNAGRDGRDGLDGRNGRDGQQGPQGPGGAAPIDVWSASIRGLEEKSIGAEKRLSDLRAGLAEESRKREAAEQISKQLRTEVADLEESRKTLTKIADEATDHRTAVIAQGGLWDVRPWWEDAHLTSRYQVGPLSLAILKAKLGVKDNVDRKKLSQPERVSYSLYDHLEILSRSNVPLTAKKFEDEITTDIDSPDWKLIALIMDICRLPR